jgi:aspartyl-tRNA(Asn)/glutamyl-tRNA(Gln) amidotransferase subunit B
MTGLAFGCTIPAFNKFDRKNYFYPDLPKGYQISQYDRPLAEHGRLEIGMLPDNSPIVIGITRVHLEEDAGKSIHDRYPGHSAIDLNRAGVPLIEIVSEPDMRSAEEARAYLQNLKQIIEYLDVSDANMEEGSLRVDANVSARLRGETKLGTKTEVKNMNSFSGVQAALEAEFARQCALLDRGEKVHQQTMLWDGAKREVRPARSKEQSHDYRYFPEPDLPPLLLDIAWIQQVKDELPEMPRAKQARFAEQYRLPKEDVEVLTQSSAIADYYESVARQSEQPKAAANWVKGEVFKAVNATGQQIDHFSVRPADLAKLIRMETSGTVSNTAARQIFARMVETGDPPDHIAQREGLLQESDTGALGAWVDEVLAENPTEAQRFRAGEKKLLGVFVGQVMKKSKGRADPRKVSQLLLERTGA